MRRVVYRRSFLPLCSALLLACSSSADVAPYRSPEASSAGGRSATSTATVQAAAAAGASASASVASSSAQAPAIGNLPCDVSDVLASRCTNCHGATPSNGAPMPLVTYADLLAPARSNKMRKVYDLVAERVKDRARPMPPDPTLHLSDAAIASIDSWIAGGVKSAAPATCSHGATGAAGGGAPGAAAGGAPGNNGTGPTATEGSATVGMSSAAPLMAGSDTDIENCYELRAHGAQGVDDKTKYTVNGGETYTGFIFKTPWTTPVQGLRFRHLPDNAAVLHHWLLYTESANMPDGSFEECALAGPTGFLCGQASTRALITGWAPGREDFRMPTDVGLELPAPGALLAVEFHYFNTSGNPAQDQSGVEICVTSKFRKNTASVSWLGTQQINVPAHGQGDATGSCTPLRRGMNATDPIHILFSWPHMHKLGRHLKSVVNRAGGMQEMLYDGDFTFEFQVLHDTPLLLNPGDSVTTTCSYDNTTNAPTGFGQSTTQEMCYNFTYAWPAHSLDNAGAELGGASNTCLH